MSAPFAVEHPVLDAFLHPGGGLVAVAVVALILLWAYATLRFNAKTERNKRLDEIFAARDDDPNSPYAQLRASFGKFTDQVIPGMAAGARPTLVTSDEIDTDHRRVDPFQEMARIREDRDRGKVPRPVRDNPQA